jgi:uncharacterized protein (DUF362 family)/Pyruvate/2-oxoacid:ferredoxin oxidoreductase delta subunit
MMKSSVSIVKCGDYTPALVQEAARKAVDSLGGITTFIRPKSRVLVKPNLLMAKEPEFAIDTHPEVVRAAVKILKEIGCEIYVGDGPSAWGSQLENVDEVYRRSGIKGVCEEEGVELIKFDKRRWRGEFVLTEWLDKCDHVLNLPKFKTHNLMLMTGAVKNLFGLVSGTYKVELHKKHFSQEDFAGMLVDIYEETMPALTIVDSIVAMEGDGPGSSGEPRQVGLLLAGSDCVALDSIMALIMGLKPHDVLTTKKASVRGLGVSDIDSITILGESLKSLIGKPFKLPSTSLAKKVPRPIVELAKKLIKYYPCVERDNCVGCAICMKACPNKAITMKNKRPAFNYAGCIACFCCQEGCPNAAIKVKKSFFAKMIGL